MASDDTARAVQQGMRRFVIRVGRRRAGGQWRLFRSGDDYIPRHGAGTFDARTPRSRTCCSEWQSAQASQADNLTSRTERACRLPPPRVRSITVQSPADRFGGQAGDSNPTAGADNPTDPYTSVDYDATTLLHLGPRGLPESTCPAGILRMETSRHPSWRPVLPRAKFTTNFNSDRVNAKNRDVDAGLRGDTRIVGINGKETYEHSWAAIEGDQAGVQFSVVKGNADRCWRAFQGGQSAQQDCTATTTQPT